MDFLTVKHFFKEYTVAEDITVVKKISFTSKEVDPFINMEHRIKPGQEEAAMAISTWYQTERTLELQARMAHCLYESLNLKNNSQ